MKLNLCCGLRPIEGHLNVDKLDLPARHQSVFVGMEFLQYDLNQRPWPWRDESVEHIVIRDGLEHLNIGTFFEITDEMWRVLVPNGPVVIRVPDARYPSAFTDPTHQMFFTPFSFSYLDPQTALGTITGHYTPYKFRVSLKEIPNEHALHFTIRKAEYVP